MYTAITLCLHDILHWFTWWKIICANIPPSSCTWHSLYMEVLSCSVHCTQEEVQGGVVQKVIIKSCKLQQRELSKTPPRFNLIIPICIPHRRVISQKFLIPRVTWTMCNFPLIMRILLHRKTSNRASIKPKNSSKVNWKKKLQFWGDTQAWIFKALKTRVGRVDILNC